MEHQHIWTPYVWEAINYGGPNPGFGERIQTRTLRKMACIECPEIKTLTELSKSIPKDKPSESTNE